MNMDYKGIILYLVVFLFGMFVLVFGGQMHNVIAQGVSGIPILNLILPLPEMISPMYYAYALFGFVCSIIVLKWAEEFFKQKIVEKPLYFLIVLITLYFVYYIAYFWYYSEAISFGAGVWPDFWTELHTSSYYAFVFCFLLGWAAEYLKRKTLN